MSFGATGGTKTFTVTSYKQELRNGHNYGNQISLTYTRAKMCIRDRDEALVFMIILKRDRDTKVEFVE